MLITKLGAKPNAEFFFKCRCGTEWYASRPEVKFTPPCMPYDVYMQCPCCKRTCFKSNQKGTNI